MRADWKGMEGSHRFAHAAGRRRAACADAHRKARAAHAASTDTAAACAAHTTVVSVGEHDGRRSSPGLARTNGHLMHAGTNRDG